MKLIIELLNFLIPYGTHAYIIMFLILLACGFGLPLPEDVVLVTGGMLASHHVTSFSVTFAVTMAGVLIGDFTIYLIGRRAGPKIKKSKIFGRIIKKHHDEKIKNWFKRFGDKVIFFARFMPGLRTPLFLTAGMYKVPAWKFLALDGIAALISVPLWIWAGFVFGENLELLEKKIHQFKVGIYGILGVVLLLVLIIWFVKRKLAKYL